MSEHLESEQKDAGGTGGLLGGFLGMFAWFNQPENVLNVGMPAESLVFALFVGLCILLGTAIERVVTRNK